MARANHNKTTAADSGLILVAMIAGRLMLGNGQPQTARQAPEKTASTKVEDTNDSTAGSNVISKTIVEGSMQQLRQDQPSVNKTA